MSDLGRYGVVALSPQKQHASKQAAALAIDAGVAPISVMSVRAVMTAGSMLRFNPSPQFAFADTNAAGGAQSNINSRQATTRAGAKQQPHGTVHGLRPVTSERLCPASC